jgi:hypothetical protein
LNVHLLACARLLLAVKPTTKLTDMLQVTASHWSTHHPVRARTYI